MHCPGNVAFSSLILRSEQASKRLGEVDVENELLPCGKALNTEAKSRGRHQTFRHLLPHSHNDKRKVFATFRQPRDKQRPPNWHLYPRNALCNASFRKWLASSLIQARASTRCRAISSRTHSRVLACHSRLHLLRSLAIRVLFSSLGPPFSPSIVLTYPSAFSRWLRMFSQQQRYARPRRAACVSA